MDAIDDRVYRKISDEERLAAFDVLQHRAESKGSIPKSPSLWLRTHRIRLEILAGVLVGGVIGAAALVINFLVFNYFMHLFL